MQDFTQEELIYISHQFTNMFGIPSRIYFRNQEIDSCFTVNLTTDPMKLCLMDILNQQGEISYYVSHDFLYYGIINYKEYKLIIGPASELELPENEVKKIAFKLDIPSEDVSFFVSELKTLSGIHLDTIIQSLIMLNFMLNRTMYDISDIRIQKSEQCEILSEMKKSNISQVIQDTPKAAVNSFDNNARSYLIEKDMIRKVTNGDVNGLIEGATKIPAVSSRQLAPHLLRHQKNFFIQLETILSRAAIEAGLAIDEIFAVEKNYMIKCESLDHTDRIKNLQYHMILDYAERVRKHKQLGNSRLINEIEKYINLHISEPIKTIEIANYLGKSRGGLTTEFKKQTGINLSDFIQLKKIELAEELLLETDKSLIAISSFLGFSTQSHFTKIFRDIKGMTPNEYRKNKKI